MHPRLKLALSVLALSCLTSSALALPDLKKPVYGYAYAAPAEGVFTARHRDGAPVALSTPPSPRDYYLFEPKLNGGGAVAQAPVIVFIHGAAPWPKAPTPMQIQRQITHYVRSGYTVVYPVFCDGTITLSNSVPAPCTDFAIQEDTALNAILYAFNELNGAGHVRPKLDGEGRPRMSFIAHSLGTIMATRMASKLGAAQAYFPSVPAPKALILFDPAGYEQKGTYDNVVVDIAKTFPLTPEALDGLRADTQMTILVAERSFQGTDSKATVLPLYFNTKALSRKAAWVVPSQCVKWAPALPGGYDYSCPAETGGPEADTILPPYQRIYRSHHDTAAIDTPAIDSHLTPISQLGFFDHALACTREALTGVAQARCSGTLRTDMGGWTENGVTVKAARPKTAYPFIFYPLPPLMTLAK